MSSYLCFVATRCPWRLQPEVHDSSIRIVVSVSAMWLFGHLRWLITLAFFQIVYNHVHVRRVSLASDGRSLRLHHRVGSKRIKDQKLSPGLILLRLDFADT